MFEFIKNIGIAIGSVFTAIVTVFSPANSVIIAPTDVTSTSSGEIVVEKEDYTITQKDSEEHSVNIKVVSEVLSPTTYTAIEKQKTEDAQEIPGFIEEVGVFIADLESENNIKKDSIKPKKKDSFEELSERFMIELYEMNNTLVASKKPNFKDSKFYTKEVPTIQDQIVLYQKFVDDSLELDDLTKTQIDFMLSFMEIRNPNNTSVFATHQSPSDKLYYQKKLIDKLDKLK